MVLLEWTCVKKVASDVGWWKKWFWLLGRLPWLEGLKSKIAVLRGSETTIRISKGKIFKWLCVGKVGLDGKVLGDTFGGCALHSSVCPVSWCVGGNCSAMYRRILGNWGNHFLVGEFAELKLPWRKEHASWIHSNALPWKICGTGRRQVVFQQALLLRKLRLALDHVLLLGRVSSKTVIAYLLLNWWVALHHLLLVHPFLLGWRAQGGLGEGLGLPHSICICSIHSNVTDI